MKRRHESTPLSQHAGVSPVSLEWRLHAFDQFELAQLYAVLAARVAVFVVEQDCPYQDLDGLDKAGMHLVAWQGAAGVAAYARILPPGARFERPSIGRVLTHAGVRRTGLGYELMRRAVVETHRLFPDQAIRLSAQCYLERFYQALGFSIVSRPYEEDGIPHVEMELPASGAGNSSN
ncbi:MAG: GNAT family N-acetyltransferase [Wenzhouxiangellaceae bacterium]|jgi:ElaA protein|nr:GNAT family N-acetyltransferase [Wenzhouxiangellaceae bacterium]